MNTMRASLEALEPSWLPTFLAVAEQLNYTRAAQRLFLSQPAVSRQMQALQRAVGVRLLEQLGKSLALTDAGRVFLGEAQRLRGDLTRAADALEALRGGVAGRLRIGASTTPGLYVLPPVLGPFLRARPGVELELQVAHTPAVEDALLHNELDVGFVGGRPERAGLVYDAFLSDEVLAYVSRAHPLARQRAVQAERLAEQTFVIPGQRSATRRAFEAWLTERGLALRRVIELDCPEAVKRLVLAGLGVGVSSCHGLPRKGGAAFKLLRVPGLDLRRTLWVVRHADKQPTVLTQELTLTLARDARRCRLDGQAHG